MFDSSINNALFTLIFWLILLAAWIVSVLWVYNNLKTRKINSAQKLLWQLFALVPIIGILTYIMTLNENLDEPKPESQSTPSPFRAIKGAIQGLSPNNGSHGTLPPPTSDDKEQPTRLPYAPSNEKPLSQHGTRTPMASYRLELMEQSSGSLLGSNQLNYGSNQIGRAHPSNIIINNDGSVSKAHAMLEVEDTKLLLRNLTEASYTWVNNQRLKPNETISIQVGDTLRFGDTRLKVDGPPLPIYATRPAPAQQKPLVVSPPPQPQSLCMLESISGPHLGESFSITEFPAEIGREHDCIVNLPNDLSVSRRHAIIYLDGGQLHLKDNNSSRGTMVFANQIEQAKLNIGDELEIGESILLVTKIQL